MSIAAGTRIEVLPNHPLQGLRGIVIGVTDGEASVQLDFYGRHISTVPLASLRELTAGDVNPFVTSTRSSTHPMAPWVPQGNPYVPPGSEGGDGGEGETRVSVTAKSVVFDIADNWGSTSIGIRLIEFKLAGVLLLLQEADFTTYETSQLISTYKSENVFRSVLAQKTGAPANNAWLSSHLQITNQRLIVVFDTPQEFDEIVVNNYHSSGGTTNLGARNVKITYSSDTITDTTYDAEVSNGEVLNDTEWAAHPGTDTVDDQVVWVGANGSGDPPDNEITAKSVVIDIADNWGNPAGVALRNVEFKLRGVTLPIEDTVHFVTYQSSGTAQTAERVFDSMSSKTGSSTSTAWLAASGWVIDQRLIAVFNSPLTFDEVVVNNHHSSGDNTDMGVRLATIIVSPSEITDATYGAAIPDGYVLGAVNTEWSQHPAADTADDQTVWDGDTDERTLGYAPAAPEAPLDAVLARSVIFDCADNYGGATGMCIRSIEFKRGGELLPLTIADFTAYATDQSGTVGPFAASHAFDTTKSKTGAAADNSWQPSPTTDMRLTIVFHAAQEFDEIVVNNHHNSGAFTTQGARHVVITASPNIVTDVTYAAHIPAGKLLLSLDEWAEHAASDAADDQTVWEFADGAVPWAAAVTTAAGTLATNEIARVDINTTDDDLQLSFPPSPATDGIIGVRLVTAGASVGAGSATLTQSGSNDTSLTGAPTQTAYTIYAALGAVAGVASKLVNVQIRNDHEIVAVNYTVEIGVSQVAGAILAGTGQTFSGALGGDQFVTLSINIGNMLDTLVKNAGYNPANPIYLSCRKTADDRGSGFWNMLWHGVNGTHANVALTTTVETPHELTFDRNGQLVEGATTTPTLTVANALRVWEFVGGGTGWDEIRNI